MSEKEWAYAIVANIVREHTDKDGIVRYGTRIFPGGRKVYISNRLWLEDKTVTVMGLNRYKTRYELERVPFALLENIRSKREHDPLVLKVMESWEGYPYGGWNDSEDSRRETSWYASELGKGLNIDDTFTANSRPSPPTSTSRAATTPWINSTPANAARWKPPVRKSSSSPSSPAFRPRR